MNFTESQITEIISSLNQPDYITIIIESLISFLGVFLGAWLGAKFSIRTTLNFQKEKELKEEKRLRRKKDEEIKLCMRRFEDAIITMSSRITDGVSKNQPPFYSDIIIKCSEQLLFLSNDRPELYLKITDINFFANNIKTVMNEYYERNGFVHLDHDIIKILQMNIDNIESEFLKIKEIMK